MRLSRRGKLSHLLLFYTPISRSHNLFYIPISLPEYFFLTAFYSSGSCLEATAQVAPGAGLAGCSGADADIGRQWWMCRRDPWRSRAVPGVGRTDEEKLEDVWGVVWEVGFGRVLLGGGL